MIFDNYPYTNFHEMNDDWVIKTLREFGQRLDEFVDANSLTYADPIEYDPDAIYAANTVVIYNNAAYVSKHAIPAGMLPTNAEYWLLIFPFGDLIQQYANASAEVLLEHIDTYLATGTATLPSMVNTWMDAHPEITTPIPNGAVSWPKLVSSLKHVILAGYAEETNSVAIDDFTQGTLSGLGVETAASNACRTGFITLPEGIYQIRAATGFVAKIWSYRADGIFVGIALESMDIQWNAFAAHANRKYRVTIMREDLQDFTPSDLPLIPVWYYANLPLYVTKELVGEISETIASKNLFNKNDYNVINANINTTTNKLVSNTALRTIYVPVQPNTSYTVSKMRSARFIIGFTDSESVENNIDCTDVVYNNNATVLTSTSGANSKWILVLCYSTSADTATIEEVLATLQIEVGDTATAYEAWFEPYHIAYDQKARSGISELAEQTGESIETLTQRIENRDVINFADLYTLTDDYIDDFYNRQDFSDADHPYTQFGTAVPVIDSTGVYTDQGVGAAIFTRPINRFPFFFTVGTMPAAYMQICFKVKAASAGQFVRVRFDPSTGVVLHESAALGYLDCATAWLFFEVMPDSVTIYDDSGNRLVAPIDFLNEDPKNYGIYFGATYKYGITSLAEWSACPLNAINIDRVIRNKDITGLAHYMDTLIYSRSYMSNGQRYTVSNPGDQYIKVVDDADNDPVIEYTNNAIIRAQMTWTDGTYRSEVGITGRLPYVGVMQRHEASIDYYIPATDNPESADPNEQFDTYILQIHNLYYSAPGWLDPPPVFVSYKGGKLYATVCYTENGEAPDSASVIKQDRYYLCDVPADWFTLGLKLRTAYKKGFGPLLTISINGVDKLNVYTPIGFNIYRDGGLTRLTFGLYAPNWAYHEYATASRKVYIANVKYKY